jgi:hypothetical protein
MTNKTKIESHLLLGSGCIDSELRLQGYRYTICASIATEDGSIAFQDLHITSKQLSDLILLASDVLGYDTF